MNSFENELLACCLDHRMIKKEGNYVGIKGEFSFPISFTGFQGHFPTQPVLPAVIQLAIIRLLAEQALTRSLFPSQYGKTKFRHIVEPEQNIIAELKLNFTDKMADCEFQLKQPDGQMISNGSCIFEYL